MLQFLVFFFCKFPNDFPPVSAVSVMVTNFWKFSDSAVGHVRSWINYVPFGRVGVLLGSRLGLNWSMA